MKIKHLSVLLLALALLVLAVTPALAKGPKGPPAFGMLYYNDHVVRTVVPPAAAPQEGQDDLYVFPDGAAQDQLPVIAVAPGDTDYHGGQSRPVCWLRSDTLSSKSTIGRMVS